MLEQTAAVIEGRVSDISYSFDDKLGPRTNVTLSGIKVDIGPLANASGTLSLPMYGGPSKDGRKFYAAAHVARFARGGTYLVFLANHDWFLSPVLRDLAFRIEVVGGKEVLVDNEGHGVSGMNDLNFLHTDSLLANRSGREHAHRLDLTPLLTISAADQSACMSKSDFLHAASYSTPGMLSTAFDGHFATSPMNWDWHNMPTATASTSQRPTQDAGPAKGR